MGRLNYENLRNAHILENQARLASLGLHKIISDLRSSDSSRKCVNRRVKKNQKVEYGSTHLRRSNRLKATTADSYISSPHPLRRKSGISAQYEKSPFSEGEEKRTPNTHLVKIEASHLQLSPDISARRCNSKGRGSVYDPTFGICCHFCRQKKLCGEEDCERCGDLDMDKPCRGKTDCSVCHSTNGVLCRACLKVRYGEEMEEVRANKEWMCPHCIEDKGINPFWICNSSLCLKKRKMVPTGIAIFRARNMGYKSVAHLLMDELQRAGGMHKRGG